MSGDGPGEKSGCCDYFSFITEADESKALKILRYANLINAIVVVVVGVLSLLSLGDLLTVQISSLAVSLYVTCFGVLLCCFEVRLSMIEKLVRLRFGFMYSFVGRTMFLVFIATLCFARDEAGTTVVSIITLLNAIMNAFVMWKHGHVFDDPTSKYSTAEQGAATFVQNHPDLVTQAVNTGASYAQSNPQVFQAGVQAGANFARENPGQAMNLAAQAQQAQQGGGSAGQGATDTSDENPFEVAKY
mmetsp:Transcript_20132/g.35782  ORF Transcript_20132/g.35782 Transcript_20132/m.35782 type:complete len:245 (+) Transcript_20132:277-1011(+)